MKNRIIALVVGMVLLLLIGCNQGGSTDPCPPSRVKGVVQDSITSSPINNALVIVDTIPDTTDTLEGMPFTYTDSTGLYEMILQGGQSDEPLSVFVTGYVSQTKYFSVEPADCVTVNFFLKSAASLSGKW